MLLGAANKKMYRGSFTTSHKAASRILKHWKAPRRKLSEAVTNEDVWTYLSNAIARPILVLDSHSAGRLYQPSHLILPGEPAHITRMGIVVSSGVRIPVLHTVVILRQGFSGYAPVRWHPRIPTHRILRNLRRWSRRHRGDRTADES